MIESGKTLSDYSIDSFIGQAVLFDVRGQNEINVDTSEIKENDMVFFFTDHIKHIHDPDYFSNNPIISKQTVASLTKNRISILGIDSFTPDNEPFHLHKDLFKHDIRIVENLVHLDKITRKRFTCYIFPLNIKDADGAPCRVVAEI
jgi:kynurenine formamidase